MRNLRSCFLGLGVLLCSEAFAAAPDAIVRFESGSSRLDDASEKTVEELVRAFRERGVEKLLLVGHTDRRGTPATNRTLSLDRARAVRALLLRLGIPEGVITVEGAGSTQTIDPADSREADVKNRRVELWVGAARAGEELAKLTWIYHRVESRKAITIEWRLAELMMPLRRRSEVRTVEDAAGEITFPDTSVLYIGGESLLMVFDDIAATQKAKARIADVRLDGGSVFARLAEREGRTLGVTSPAAEHNLKTKRARVTHAKKRGVSTIAVYAGRAEVKAQGETVAVKEGYGTRTKNGQPPEAPTPLPRPPEWRSTDALVAVGTSSIALGWTNAGTSSVAIEVAALDDPGFVRPLRRWSVAGDAAVIDGPPIGAYRVRLSSVDRRGLVGEPSAPRTMIIMAGAIGDDRLPARSRSGRIELGKAGGLRFVAPSGVVLAAGLDRDAPSGDRVVVSSDREHVVHLELRTKDGEDLGRAELAVSVGVPEIVLDAIHVGSVGRWATTVVRFRAQTSGGVPVTGLRLLAYDDGGASAPEVLALGGKTRAVLVAGAAPSGTRRTIAEVAPGRYVLHYDEALRAEGRTEVVTIYEPSARLVTGVRFDVKGEGTAPVAKAAPTEDPWLELFAQARAGLELQRAGGVRPIFGLELGVDFSLFWLAHLDLSVGAGWVRRRVETPAEVDADVVPMEVRLAVAFRGESFGGYAGGLAGVSFSEFLDDTGSSRTQLRAGGFAGVAYDFGVPSIFLEAQWTETGVKGAGDGLGSGPAFFGGIRISVAP